MKRIIIMMLILLMSAACSMQQKNDDAYEYAKMVATGHIETVLGYDPESNYSLHKVKGVKDEFPYIYQVTKDQQPVLYIEFVYDDNILYSGFSFDYGEGYLIPTVKEQYFKLFESDDYLYSVALNPEMEYKGYHDVVFQHLDVDYDQEVMDKAMSYLSESDSGMLPEGIQCQKGDLIQLGKPILYYEIVLNEDKKTIEVNQLSYFDYPIYINNQLKCLASASFYEEGSGFGFKRLEECLPIYTNDKFIIVTTGTLYSQDFFVTEDGITNSEIKVPLYVNAALDSIQNMVKDIEPSTAIVAARTIESAGFIENSMKPESYKAVEDFGIGEIMSEDPLYDPDYNEIGYVYSLDCDGLDGYAITVKKGGSYLVNEASSDTANPYDGLSKDTIRVYAGSFGYFFYLENGLLMNLRTNEEVDPDNVRRYQPNDD